jgi:membrane associated rhomboid family serine protease
MFFIAPWRLRQSEAPGPIPVANFLLIALCVLFYLLGWSWEVGPGPRPASLLLYGFSHCNFWHLAANMWALWIFGNPVNRRLGNTFYLLVYLTTLLVLGLVGRIFLGTAMVGASGALFAVIAVALMLMPNAVLEIACAALPLLSFVIGLFSLPKRWHGWLIRWKIFGVPALWCLVVIPLTEFVFFLLSGWSLTHLVHQGGRVCGVIAVLLLPARITMRYRAAANF